MHPAIGLNHIHRFCLKINTQFSTRKSITLPGRVKSVAAGRAAVELTCELGSEIECKLPDELSLRPGQEVDVSLRPEGMRLANGHDGTLHGVVEAVLYQGERSECEVKIGDIALCVYLPPGTTAARGDKIALAIVPDAPRLWAKAGGGA